MENFIESMIIIDTEPSFPPNWNEGSNENEEIKETENRGNVEEVKKSKTKNLNKKRREHERKILPKNKKKASIHKMKDNLFQQTHTTEIKETEDRGNVKEVKKSKTKNLYLQRREREKKNLSMQRREWEKKNLSMQRRELEKKILPKNKKKASIHKMKYNLFQQTRTTEFEEEERRCAELLFNSDDEKEEPRPKKTKVDEIESLSTQKRKAVWEDEDDLITVKEVVKTYTRGNERLVNGKIKYKQNLREKFTNVYGNTPNWAQLKKVKLDDEASDSAEEEKEEEWDPRKKTTVYLSEKDCGKLAKSELSFKFIDDLNKGTYQGKFIQSIEFIENLKIVLVAGFETEKFGTVTLFQFNGKENYKIKSVVFPKFPVKCARFLPSRQRFVVGCNLYARFFVYDIEESRKIDIFLPNSMDKSSSKLFEVSPDEKYIAFVRNSGLIDMYDANSLSPFQNFNVPCDVKALTFSPDSSALYTIGSDGKVYIFDLHDWNCRHAFYDEGCIEGTAITISPNGLFLACGSSSGIINIYQTSLLSSSNPKPIKTLGCLVTQVTHLVFNNTSEILAAASSYKDNAIKLIHTGSFTVFSNFPGKLTFRKVRSLSFSPDSKYLVMGDNQRARLCRLFYY